MKHVTIIGLALCASACAMHHAAKLPAPIPAVSGKVRDVFALKYIDIAIGTGAPVEAKKCLYVHYTGWLTNGKKFDSSRDFLSDGSQHAPIAFPQGVRRVIQGWDLGFEGMRVGGKRRLFIPYQLGYGEAGAPPDIPPKSELIFDVELMAVGAQAAQCPAWESINKK